VFPLKDDVPTLRVPIVTMALIAGNALAFLWQLSFGLQQSVLVGGAIPYEILSFQDVGPPDLVPPPFTIFTSMFLHGGLAHIGGNMWFLWIFGNNVEDALGRVRFLLFYLVCGVIAALSQTFVTAATSDPSVQLVPMVGASGAIAGVLAGYLVLFPRARVLTLIFIVIFVRLLYLPASLFIGFWFAMQLLAAFAGAGGGTGVAFVAHVGGFVAGFVLVKLMGPMRDYRRPFAR
jgi:membrane associated rhomboid family serine protease